MLFSTDCVSAVSKLRQYVRARSAPTINGQSRKYLYMSYICFPSQSDKLLLSQPLFLRKASSSSSGRCCLFYRLRVSSFKRSACRTILCHKPSLLLPDGRLPLPRDNRHRSSSVLASRRVNIHASTCVRQRLRQRQRQRQTQIYTCVYMLSINTYASSSSSDAHLPSHHAFLTLPTRRRSIRYNNCVRHCRTIVYDSSNNIIISGIKRIYIYAYVYQRYT
jgi:hypothetical protein